MATMETITERDGIKTITAHFIDGAFVESRGREVMDIIKPTNGKVIARVTLGDEEDTRRAIAAATRAFPTFGRTTTEERAGCGAWLYVAALVRAQRAEELLRTVRAELAHVSRVTTLGQLTASIAHEITQPIASTRNNARAALNFLGRQPPELGEVREALSCIVGDADRAGDIIDRIRDHIKKSPARKARFRS
jgi:C4-dicarboxylate-specific signal transduction histidine kinase